MLVYNTRKIYAAGLITAAFMIVCDRFFKLAALSGIWEDVELIGSLLGFSYARNYGIAFSLPLGGVWLVIATSLILLVLAYFFLAWFSQKDVRAVLLFGIILGAASNLWDRVLYGFVIDYLDLEYFTVFNLADVLIVGSVVILVGIEIKKSFRQQKDS